MREKRNRPSSLSHSNLKKEKTLTAILLFLRTRGNQFWERLMEEIWSDSSGFCFELCESPVSCGVDLISKYLIYTYIMSVYL